MIDQEIVNKAKKNDLASIERVYDYYQPKIYHYFFYRTQTTEDAQDLTHEVFIRMVKSLGSQEGNFESWLFTIARNMLTDYYRSKAHRGHNKELEEKDAIIEDVEDKKLNHEDLWKAIKQIPDEQQEVVIMRIIDDLSNKQIADITGKTEGAVKALQFRAVKSLQKILRV